MSFVIADLSPLVDVVLKVTVLLAIAAIAARALARRSAAARHQVWAVAIAASLMMPVLATVAPQWTIAVLPTPAATVDAPQAAAPVVAEVVADPVFEPLPAITPDESARPEPAQARASRLSTPAAIWLLGVLLVLARLAFGTVRVWWIARRATPATVWAPLGQRLAQSLGIQRPVTFLSGDEDAMPMACGLVRARVLLPAEADEWPLERQRVVLLHELAHVKRRDCLTQMLAHLACATYWFNPLVWLAAQRLRAERERACDDLVLAAGTRGSDYADHLLDIARSLRSGAWPTWSAVTMAHRSQLEGRLMAILDPALPRRSPTRRSVVACSALAIASVVWLAGARPVAKEAEAAEQGRPSAPSAPAPTPAPMPTPEPASVAAPIRAPRPAPLMAAVPTPMPPLPPQAVPTPAPAPMPQVFVEPNIVAPPELWPAVEFSVREALSAFGLQDVPPPGSAQAGVQPPQPPRGQQGRQSQTPADPKITAALTAALKDEDEDVRGQALQTLVRMRAPLPTDVLGTMLKDKSPDVRRQAIHALGQMRDAKYVTLIIDAMKDGDPDVRQQAAFALAQMRDPRAVDPLIAALKDMDSDVRRQAAHGLGMLRDARAVDPLIAALKDTDADVRQQVVFALGQIR